MGDIKVTGVYGESNDAPDSGIFSDHMIVSDGLRDLLDIPEETTAAPIDINELSLTIEADENINALVRGNLFSIKSAQYLIVKFIAKSDCSDMLQILRSSTDVGIKGVKFSVSGKYGFDASAKQLDTWELEILEDRSALLTFTMRTKNVIFR